MAEGTGADGPSVLGEEAHIISAAPSGPRAGHLRDHDAHENLILLCRQDHKRIDDQVAHYTSALLSTIKRDHERWIAGLGTSSSRPRLVRDLTRPVTGVLQIVTSGSRLWDLASGTDTMRPSWPGELSEDQQDLVAAFLDSLRDWIDAHSADDGYQAGRDAVRALNGHVLSLNEAGLQLGVRIRHLLLTGGSQDPVPCRELDIQIRPLAMRAAPIDL